MTIRAALLAAVTALAAVPALSQPDWSAAGRDGEGDPNSGRFLAFGGMYGELRLDCVRCHELDGSGNSSGAFPRLADQSAWYLYKTLLDYAAGLRPSDIMAPIARMLTDEQMQDLAAYYATVVDAPYPAAPAVDVGVLQIGGAIAAVGIPGQGVPPCDSCHGPHGIGAPPIYPYLAGQFAPYLEDQLLLWKHGRRDGDAMNVMEMIARNMTEEQIRAVSLYFASIRPPEVTPEERSSSAAEGADQVPVAGAAATNMGAVQDPEPGPPEVLPSTEPAAAPEQ
jgi:cytochrome c553